MLARYAWLPVLMIGFSGCDGGDGIAPRELAGTWLSARIQHANVLNVPDTLTLDANGTGRLVVRAFVGESPPYREEWWTSDVRYDVRDDRVFFSWCPAPPGRVATCAGWNASGRLEDGGTLVVAPTDPASSIGPTPWVRFGS